MTTLHLIFPSSTLFGHLFTITTNRCSNTNYISTITTKSKSKTHYRYDSHQKINSMFFSNTMSTALQVPKQKVKTVQNPVNKTKFIAVPKADK